MTSLEEFTSPRGLLSDRHRKQAFVQEVTVCCMVFENGQRLGVHAEQSQEDAYVVISYQLSLIDFSIFLFTAEAEL